MHREWQVYRNTDGITTTMRNHLKLRHNEEYERIVSCLKLKHSNEFNNPVPTAPSHHGPFKLDEWITLMVRWIVTDDQVCFITCSPIHAADCLRCKAINVIESKEFREFVLYGRDNVTERDLPHRTKLIELIFRAYEEEHRKLLDDFKVSKLRHCHALTSLTSLNTV
jgi:hypothetical protein